MPQVRTPVTLVPQDPNASCAYSSPSSSWPPAASRDNPRVGGLRQRSWPRLYRLSWGLLPRAAVMEAAAAADGADVCLFVQQGPPDPCAMRWLHSRLPSGSMPGHETATRNCNTFGVDGSMPCGGEFTTVDHPPMIRPPLPAPCGRKGWQYRRGGTVTEAVHFC